MSKKSNSKIKIIVKQSNSKKKVIDKKVLPEIEPSESENEKEGTKIMPKSSNLNLETEKNAANKVHFNLKSYKCKICYKSFQKEYSLKRHMKLTHHRLEPFPCNYCVDFYSNKTKYRKHLAEHHSIFPMEWFQFQMY